MEAVLKEKDISSYEGKFLTLQKMTRKTELNLQAFIHLYTPENQNVLTDSSRNPNHQNGRTDSRMMQITL